jgi:fibronectin-binding autotransporter adhesin
MSNKKKHAAIAIALVTGGFSAPNTSKAGLFGTPVQNGGFDYDIVNNPNPLGYDYQLHDWFRYSGGELWQAEANVPVSFPGAFNNSAYAIVQGQSYRGAAASNNSTGEIYQQIGTTQANTVVNVNFLEAYLQGGANSVTVSLFSGGAPARTYAGYTGGYNVYGSTHTLAGAIQLGTSVTIAADTSNPYAFEQELASFNTGTGGTAGAPLWLDFTVNNTNYASDQIALDDVTASSPTATPVSTWTGSVSGNWNTTDLNFGATPYANGNAVVFGDVAGSTALNINAANVSPTEVTFNNSSKNYTLSGAYGITGGAQLTKNGTGSLTITNANSFTGNVYLNAGVINLQNSSALGTSTGVYVASGATLQLQGGITIGSTAGTLPLDISGAGTGAAGTDGALVNVSGSNTYAGPISIGNNATIAVDSGNLNLTDGTNVITDGIGTGYTLTLAGAGNGQLSAGLGGSSGLIKNGAGTWTLSAESYFSGGTVVNGGTLVLTYGGYAGTIRGPLTINSGAAVTLSTDDAFGYGGGDSVTTVNVNGGTLDNATGSNEGYITDYNLTGGTISSTGGGPYAFTGGYNISSNASSVTSVFSGPIVMREGSSNMVFTVAQGTTPSGIDLNVTGVISQDDRSGNGGQFGVDKEGPGVLALTGSNTYQGATIINGGTLMIGDGTVGHDGAINANGGIVNNAALVYDTAISHAYAGSISGSGTITKIGPGSLILSGGSSYSGPVTVSAGKLYVNGSFGTSSTFNVSSGATLGGTGTVSSPVTIATGGIIEGGQNGSGQTYYSSPVTFSGTGFINIGPLANYGSSSAVNFGAGLTANGGSNSISVDVSTADGASVGSTYQLFNYSGTTPLADLKVAIGGRATGTVSDTGSQIDLTLVSTSAPIIYTGAAGAVWNTTAQSWTFNGSPTAYIDSPGDEVVFDDTAPSAATTLSINAATVHPSSVSFNNSSNNYVINGPYGIAGSTGITLNGTGMVTLTNSNSYTGVTLINSGTLQLGDGTSGHDGTVGAAGGITNNGALVFDYAGAQTYAGVISGTGTLTKSGPGTLTLTGQNSYAATTGMGITNITAGTLIVSTQPASTLAYTVSPGALLEVGYSTASTGYTTDLTVINGAGVGTTELAYKGGISVNINAGLFLQTAPTTISTYGSGVATLYGFDSNSAQFQVANTASGSVSTAGVDFKVTYYGLSANISSGANTATGDFTINGPVTGNATSGFGLIKRGTGSLVLAGADTYGPATLVNAGTVIFTGAAAYPPASTANPFGTALNISSGAAAISTAHTSSTINVLQASALTLAGTTDAWTGSLDLNNNDLIVSVSTGLLSDVTNQVKQGFNGGAWNGPNGIISTSAATDSRHLTALGVIVNDNGSGSPLYGSGGKIASTFDGTPSADGDILVKYTYYGDANLDGAVDGSDYTRIDAGFTSGGTLTGWANGDFNYDGVIDGSDYTLIDNAFNTQGASLGSNPAALVASSTAQIAGGSSAVPEPTTLGLLGIGALGLFAKRRRRHLGV